MIRLIPALISVTSIFGYCMILLSTQLDLVPHIFSIILLMGALVLVIIGIDLHASNQRTSYVIKHYTAQSYEMEQWRDLPPKRNRKVIEKASVDAQQLRTKISHTVDALILVERRLQATDHPSLVDIYEKSRLESYCELNDLLKKVKV